MAFTIYRYVLKNYGLHLQYCTVCEYYFITVLFLHIKIIQYHTYLDELVYVSALPVLYI
jgi:hypothetical protein